MKKNVKIIISVISAITVISGAFSGCGKAESASVQDLQDDIAGASYTQEAEEITQDYEYEYDEYDSTPETTSESVTHVQAEKKQQKVKTDDTKTTTAKAAAKQNYLTADSKDKKTFASFMEYVFLSFAYGKDDTAGGSNKEFYEHNYRDFDCTSENALRFASGVFCGDGYTFIDGILDSVYGLKLNKYVKYHNDYGETSDRDPLKKFRDGAYYLSFDGKKYDALIKDIFNVTPNHSYEFKDPFSGETSMYYADGKYHAFRYEFGLSECPKIEIKKMDAASDGKYNITAAFYDGYAETPDDEPEFIHVFDLNVVAALKNIDGKRVWSIYSIKKA